MSVWKDNKLSGRSQAEGFFSLEKKFSIVYKEAIK